MEKGKSAPLSRALRAIRRSSSAFCSADSPNLGFRNDASFVGAFQYFVSGRKWPDMGRAFFLDFLGDGLGLRIFLAAPHNELWRECDADQRHRKYLQRL